MGLVLTAGTHLLHVDRVALELIIIWGVLSHDQLVADNLEVVKLTWEKLWEVPLMRVQRDSVLSSLSEFWLEIENNTRDLLGAVLGLSTGKYDNSSIGESGSTLEMESVNLMSVLFEYKSPVHVLSVVDISDL